MASTYPLLRPRASRATATLTISPYFSYASLRWSSLASKTMLRMNSPCPSSSGAAADYQLALDASIYIEHCFLLTSCWLLAGRLLFSKTQSLRKAPHGDGGGKACYAWGSKLAGNSEHGGLGRGHTGRRNGGPEYGTSDGIPESLRTVALEKRPNLETGHAEREEQESSSLHLEYLYG